MKRIAFVTMVLAGAACGSTKNDNSSGTSTDKTAEPPAKPAWKKLGGLALEAEVVASATIEDTTKGAGYPSVTIFGAPTTFVNGGGEMSDLKPTLEDTKTQLGKSGNKVKKFTKEDKTADGWVIELEAESITGDPLLGISVRRTIDGKPWDCTSNVRSADELAAVRKVCQSLRAAK